MTSPTVSVILPTYNRASLLSRAIESVLAQTYRDFELIVVDDCSTDNTEQTLANFTDPRLRVIRQAVNSGPSAARNAGIQASVGSFIAFQDSDDEWFTEKLAKQMAILELKSQDGIYPAACYSRFVVLEGHKQNLVPPDSKESLSGDIYSRLLRGNTMGTPVMLLKKEVLESIGGFDESMSNLEDWDLALRVAQGRTIAFLDEITLTSYSTPRSVNKLVAPDSLITIFTKHRGSYEKLPAIMADMTWRIGSQFASSGARTEALQYMRISVGQSFNSGRYFLLTLLRIGLAPYKMALSSRNLLQRTFARMQKRTLSARSSGDSAAKPQTGAFPGRRPQ